MMHGNLNDRWFTIYVLHTLEEEKEEGATYIEEEGLIRNTAKHTQEPSGSTSYEAIRLISLVVSQLAMAESLSHG